MPWRTDVEMRKCLLGGMAERFNAPVLKTGVGLVPTVGSNPTPSAGPWFSLFTFVSDISAAVPISLRASAINHRSHTSPDREGYPLL